MNKINRLNVISLAVVVITILTSTLMVKAATNDISGAVTQSYSADSSVQVGMIVGPSPKDASTVVALDSKDIVKMLGVVVPVDSSTIVLTPQSSSTQQVLVASYGRYSLLVSNQGGVIKNGDYITVSAVAGIGMKAGAEQSQTMVIGQATSSFDGKTGVVGATNLKNSSGGSTPVTFGRVNVNVHLAPNPLIQNSTNLPGIFARTANGVANRSVSSARLYLSAVVLIATLFIVSNIFFSGIRGGIMAVGRNPLAKKAISRSLVQTITAGMAMFVAGMIATYLILKI